MTNGMGKAMGTRTILYVAVGDRVSIMVVVVAMSFTVTAGPEQKKPGTLSESVSIIQANIWWL